MITWGIIKKNSLEKDDKKRKGKAWNLNYNEKEQLRTYEKKEEIFMLDNLSYIEKEIFKNKTTKEKVKIVITLVIMKKNSYENTREM